MASSSPRRPVPPRWAATAGGAIGRRTSRAAAMTGLLLRCASDSLLAHNPFDGLDHYAFYVAAGGSFAGSIAGLRIVDNVIYRGRAYSLTSGLPTSLVIDPDPRRT